jgi:hypothetical protein
MDVPRTPSVVCHKGQNMMYLALLSPFVFLALLSAMPRFERFMLGSQQETSAGAFREAVAGSRTQRRRRGGRVRPWW